MSTTSSEIFTSFCSDLLASADNVDALFDFSAIAITAWNYADTPETGIVQAIEHLIKRLKREEAQNSGKTFRIRDMVRMMIDRKNRDFGKHSFKIAKADFENEANGIKVNVQVVC